MAVRTDVERVKEIITTSLADEVVASNMIVTAANLVDTHLLNAGHSANTLEQIEMYLAAHLVALTEEKGGLVRSQFGDAEEWFSDQYNTGLRMTRFGQIALAIDSSGILANISASSAGLKAQFRIV